MTVFEFAITYAVCWWLVLFMLLPHQATPPAQPEVGHARSAPANPQIKKKLRWATILALIPAVAMYFVVTASARAEDSIYHAGNHGCEPVAATTGADVATRDGYGTGDKQVAPANLDGGSAIANRDYYDIALRPPVAGYLDHSANTGTNSGGNSNAGAGTGTGTGSGTTPSATNGRNVDLSQSFINMGNVRVGKDGSATMNGQPLAQSASTPPGCKP